MEPQQALFLRDFLVPRFEEEIRETARVLAAVPEIHREYRPDPKSRSALELAWHIVSSEIWYLEGIVQGHFAPEPARLPRHIRSIQDIIELHRTSVPELLGQVRQLKEAELLRQVPVNSQNHPAVVYLMNLIRHTAHHRGQLCSYLRPMGAKVPTVYGDMGDEPAPAPARY
ncbi:MAG TPA: DinB family protein [Bryobacteraceae bacterium]|nr:DinB family protein [Bryobacteraceae bacterium]HOL72514.1 DinB family protein [Bryobacteraceae bacterium]HOQ44459.1 DinB family protein [Bryobacteraceae bacterium]HPQ15279.1 DinB family protein [Bryobacteraceae bacterium]HPU70778.1 DinB family protein [Bryobacteraceae bacterium]